MKALNVLLALLVSALIAVGVFEGGLRLLGMGPPKVLNQFDPALGWSKQPGLSVSRKTGEYRAKFELNEHGFRDDAGQSSAKPEGTTRVVALGDSFTLGFAVERDDLFVDQLEAWWQAEGRKIDVVNTGTEGYSTDQEVAWLLTHGDEWKPDVVLLFAYENDIYYNGQDSYGQFPKPRFTPGGELEAGTLTDPGERSFFQRTAIGNLVSSKPEPALFTPSNGGRKVLADFAPLFVGEAEALADPLARTAGALKALKAKCDQLGAKAVLVTIPSHSVVDETYAASFGEKVLGAERSAWDPNQPVDLFLAAAAEAGVPAIDPRAQLKAQHTEDKPLYYEVDFHLNPAGNRALAGIVHDELQSMGVLAAPTEPVALADLSVGQEKDAGGMPGWLPWFLGLWLGVGGLYCSYYKDEKAPIAFLKVGALLGTVFAIAIGGTTLLGMLPPAVSRWALLAIVVAILGFVAYKLGDRIGTITELIVAFVGRGHWYLMPLVVILLTVGSLLVVAASSPLVAPFIYTLF